MVRWLAYYVSQCTQVGGIFCAGFAAAVVKTEASYWGPIESLLKLIQANAWWIIVAGSLAALVAKLFSGLVGPPWAWAALRRTLTRIRLHIFTGVAGEPTYDHRVTLFRRKPCFLVTPWRHKYWPWGWGRWPWSGWMVSVARSGDTKQTTRAVFLAPHDADKSEGIVGNVWQTREVKYQLLPELAADSGNRAVEKYATAAMLPVEWVRHRMKKGFPFPRLLCGIPIEANNKMWGVLVFDSTRQDTLDIEKTFPTVAKMVPAQIEELLKRI